MCFHAQLIAFKPILPRFKSEYSIFFNPCLFIMNSLLIFLYENDAAIICHRRLLIFYLIWRENGVPRNHFRSAYIFCKQHECLILIFSLISLSVISFSLHTWFFFSISHTHGINSFSLSVSLSFPAF